MLRTKTFVVTAEGRDKGGVFVLTEKPAVPATDLCIRAMQLMARAGIEVPANIFGMGAAGFFTMGIGAVLTGIGKAPWSDIKPLLAELLACVTSYQPPGGSAALSSWGIIETQIQEPSTILKLYEEVVSLHLGFSVLDRMLHYQTLAAQMIRASGLNTETSTEQSELSSQAA